MRILFCGDVVGRSGRDAIADHLPRLREALKLDFVIVNGENAAHGFGITEKICEILFQAGADCITGGNHSWDKPEIATFMESGRSGPLSGSESLRGLRWREFHCLRGRRGAGMKFSQRFFY